ncbi:MAG: amidohydrolase family protein [Planctomycetota bacterium]|nr:amidohydrolase family protein [Planctomycetota bacterium]
MMRCLTALLLFLAITPVVTADTVLVYGDTIHTMAGDAIEDGYVLVRDGDIAAVGQAADFTPDGTETILRATVVTPGLIDAHTCVGLAGHLNIKHDRDELDEGAPLQPHLRALDAYNPRERLVEWVRGFGVTTVHTGHAPESLISGQTMIVKTTGNRVEDAVIEPVAMIACSMSDTAIRGESPGTRAKAAALLRQRLLDAQHYARKQAAREAGAIVDDDEKDDSGKRDLELESLAAVLAGETPLLIHAHKARDIANALRLREEFDIPIVLDGASEAYILQDDIKEAGVPVFIHPTMIRPFGERENLSFETASKLIEAGIPVAMQSGYESYVPRTRVVLYEAGMAAANGCEFDDALAMITITPARILGIDDRVGSIEVGKDGDLALYDGDPFEWTSHCTGVVIDGAVASSTPR